MNRADWKTKTAGIIGGVVGIGSLALKFLGVDVMSTEASVALAVGGFAVFGLGDKVQKLLNAIQAVRK